MPLTFLDAGQLTARLDLEAPVETPDGQGGVTIVHQAETALWARIEPVTGASEELGEVLRDTVTHRIWIRHFPLAKAGKRFRKGMRLFAIESVRDPDETGRYLVCDTREERS
jgi:SPP1 family predicted phage head-tail adaptor